MSDTEERMTRLKEEVARAKERVQAARKNAEATEDDTAAAVAVAEAKVAEAEAVVAEAEGAEAEVAKAKAEVANAEAKVAKAKAQVAKAKAKAEVEVAKAKAQVAKAKAKAKAEVAKAKAEVAKAKAQVAKAKAQVAKAKVEVAKAKVEVAKAKVEVAKAEAKYKQVERGSFEHEMAKKSWESANEQVKYANEQVRSANEKFRSAVMSLSAARRRRDALAESAVHDGGSTMETLELKISAAKTDIYNETVQRFQYTPDTAEWRDKPNDLAEVGQYKWLESNEDRQDNRAGYMAYLQALARPPDTLFFDCSAQKNLLNVQDLERRVHVSGKIDVVLAGSLHADNDYITLRRNILVGVELKKGIETKDRSQVERQATLQHLAASILNPSTGILTLLTDLNDIWRFCWFVAPEVHNKRLMKYSATRLEAQFLLKNALEKPGDISFPTGFLTRLCWNDFDQSLESILEHSEDDNGDTDNSESKSDKDGDTDSQETGDQGSRSGSGQAKTKNRHHKKGRRTSHQGQSARSGKRGKQCTQAADIYMDFMDEEEMRGAMVVRALEMFDLLPEPEEEQGTSNPPSEIVLSHSISP